MKKTLLGFAGLLVMAFIVVLFVNAIKDPETKKSDNQKAPVQCTMTCNHGNAASGCPMMKAEAEKKSCDPSKCKMENCDPSKCTEKNCDKSGCAGKCTKMAGTNSGEMKCPMHSAK